jgi:hypothetical protein
MTLGVEREWKKRNNSGKDYSGDPETAYMHDAHDFIQNSRRLSDIDYLLRHQIVFRHRPIARTEKAASPAKSEQKW